MKKIVIAIFVVFILIQFIRPAKNDSKNYVNDISTVMEVPTEVEQILKTSCNDCHSNYTVYPWYNEVAPISWYLASHVNDGKKHMNLSEWTVYNNHQKEHILKDFEKVLKSHKMPLESYLWIHKDAKMSAEQYAILMNWVKTIKVN